MMIIINELKKIWNIKNLAITTLLCVLGNFIFMHIWINIYPKGTWEYDVDIAHYLTENYGAVLDPDEFRDFMNFRSTIIDDLNLYVESSSLFSGSGIYNFDDYEAQRNKYSARYDALNEDERNLYYSIIGEWGIEIYSSYINNNEGGYIKSGKETPLAFNKYNSFNNAAGMYESQWLKNINSFIEQSQAGEKELKRLKEIRDSGEMLSIISQMAVYHTWKYAQGLSSLTALSVLILVSFLITNDRACKVNLLQYTSKQGRSMLKKQFAAVMISAVFITTILALIFGGIFSLNETFAFWNNNINSFLSYPYHWLSITYGQYCFLLIAVIYLLSAGAAAFAFLLSRFSGSMIRLLLKITPFFIAACMLSYWLTEEFLGIHTGGNITLKILTLLFFPAAGIIAAAFAIRREKKVEMI